MKQPCSDPAPVPQLSWGLISQYRNALFGLSILLIMWFHSGTFRGFSHHPAIVAFLPTGRWIHYGSVGVDLFLFLSGMGLYFAMCKRPTLPRFYLKRLKRILIPYVIIGGAYWVYRDIALRDNLPRFWEDFSLMSYYTKGMATFWYIAAILPLYLLAPLFLRLFRTRFRTPLLFALFFLSIGLSLYLGLYQEDTYWHLEKGLNRIFIFVLGCYFGAIIQEKRPMSSGWLLFAILALSSRGLIYYLASLCPIQSIARLIVRQWFTAGGFALAILLSTLLALLRSRQFERFLGFFGALSLELYLSHLAVRNSVRVLCPDFKEWGLGTSLLVYLGILLTACLISLLLHKGQTKLESLFTHNEGSRETQ